MLDLDRVFPDRAPLLLRRLTAAIPEVTLAVTCFQAGLDALSGEAPSVYLYGLIAIELLGLAWLRLALSPWRIAGAASPWRKWLAVGGTGAAAATTFVSSLLLLVLLAFVMLFDPRTFVFLLLALTRRAVWRWAWALRSVQDARALQAHSRRAVRAHALAVVASVIAVAILNGLLEPEEHARAALADALSLTGMAGYFSALAVYLLLGRTPLEDDSAAPLLEESRPRLPPLQVRPLVRMAADHAFTLLPGAVLLWAVMATGSSILDPGPRMIAAPLGVALGGWLLAAGAARTLRLTDGSIWKYGFARAGEFTLRIAALWMATLAAGFLAVPIVAGILDVELQRGNEPAALLHGFGLALLVIAWGLSRLWPLAVIPFLVADRPPLLIPHGVRDAWRMTAGGDGFFRGALPPVLALAAALALLALDPPFSLVAKPLAYFLLAPLIAVLAVERATAMADLRVPAESLSRADVPNTAADPRQRPGATRTPPAKPEASTPHAPPVLPIPLPLPRAERGGSPRAASGPPPPSGEPPAREYPYWPHWSNQEVYGSALYNEDLPMAAAMVEKGVPLDSEIGDGDPALLWVARMGRTRSFRWLLDRGADVHGRARLGGATVLHYAAATPAMVSYLPELLGRGPRVDALDNHGQSAFIAACRAGCIAGARILLARGAEARRTDNDGTTALHHFVNRLAEDRVSGEQLAFLRELLALGLDPLAIGASRRHAVALAAERGLVPVLELFREAGVDLARPDAMGLTALGAAVVNGKVDTVRRLHAMGQPLDLPGAIALGEGEVVARLLREDPRRAGEPLGATGLDPLYVAIRHRQADIVHRLLAAGAEPRASRGWTGSLLHDAVRHLPDPAVLQALIDRGADVDAVDGDLNTPLNFAARADALAAAELLLQAGADPHAKTERGAPIEAFARSEPMRALLRRHGTTSARPPPPARVHLPDTPH